MTRALDQIASSHKGNEARALTFGYREDIDWLRAIAVLAVALPPSGALDEAMYVSKLGVLPVRAFAHLSSARDRPIPGVRSDRRSGPERHGCVRP